MNVDPRLLESFVVVGEELHFTRAAERLHVAQPALSQQIARLERQLGVTLFTRAPVTLTAPGQALFDRVRPALREVRAAIEAARRVSAGEAGTIRAGHLSSLGPRVIPALVHALSERRPGLSLVALACSVEEQLEGLRSGTLDVGLFYLDREFGPGDAALHVYPIASGPHYVAVPRDHPLASSSTVELDAFAGEPWIEPSGTATSGYQAQFFQTICRRHGFAPRIAARANSIETMLGMVSAGLGIAPAPWTVLLRPLPDVVLIETPGETFDIVAAVAVPGAAAAVIEVARDVIGELALSVAPTAR